MQFNSIETPKLVIFDVEGVIIPKDHFLLFEAIQQLRKTSLVFVLMILAILYKIGTISLEFTIRRAYRLFKGTTYYKFYQTFIEIPIIPETFEVFHQLKEKGFKIILMSSGLPTLFVEYLAERLEADYAYGLELEVLNGCLTGEIKGDIIKRFGKANVLKNLQKELHVSKNNCVVVGDDRNNLQLLKLCQISIAYNPDIIFANKCNYVVKGNLTGILFYLEPNIEKSKFKNPTQQELLRKTIHIGSFLIPIICKFLQVDKYLVGCLIILVTITYIISEYARFKNVKFPIFYAITSKAVIAEENWSYATAPLLFSIGIIIPLLIFPIPIGYVAISILTLGDGFATIFGKKFGKTILPFNKSKSLEGTFFGFTAAFLGTLIFVDPLRGLIAAITGMLAEVIPSSINDNLSIPILSGISIMILN